MSISPNVNMSEETGQASNCAKKSRATVLALADALGDDPNGENFSGYLGLYNSLYCNCMGLNC